MKANRIVTVASNERRGRPRREQLYVYKHPNCRRCSGEIGKITLAARALYYCPRCQPLPRAQAGGRSRKGTFPKKSDLPNVTPL